MLGLGLNIGRVSFVSPFLLDQHGIKSKAVCAYSLTRLSYRATKCIRVRRDSDNEEIDIGFKSGVIDVASLFAFVGENNGLVTIWYDQSGNNINAVQSITDRQPRIVTAGSLENGILFINTSNHWMNIADNDKLRITQKPLTISAKISRFSDSSTSWLFSRNLSGTDNMQYGILYNDNGSTSFHLENSQRSGLPSDSIIADTVTNIAHIWQPDNATRHYTDANLRRSSSYDGALTDRPYTHIGCRSSSSDGTSKTSYFKGNVINLMLFNADMTDYIGKMHV